MSRIDGPGDWRIVVTRDGDAVAEPLDDGSGHPLPAEGYPVVHVRDDNGHLIGYQTTGRALKLPDGQVLPSGIETELVGE